MYIKMKVLFYHSLKRTNKKGVAPVYCRITIHKTRSDFSTGIFVSPAEFKNEMILGNSEATDLHNTTLVMIRNKANSIYLDYKIKEMPISPQRLADIVTGKAESNKSFLAVADEFLKTIESKPGVATGTVKKHQTFHRNLVRFLTEAKQRGIYLEEFNYALAEKYRSWLFFNVHSTNTKLPATQDHYARHLLFCKNTFRFAKKSQYIKWNPLDEIDLSRGRRPKTISLSDNEFLKFVNAQWIRPGFKKVKHLFLFQSGLGLLYGDLKKYDVKIGEDQRPWILSDRDKNQNPYAVPFFDLSREIWELYNGELPKMTLQAYNRCLKEMAAILGIEKKVTTKLARKVFANLKKKDGWSVKAIADMLGHKHTSTTENYYLTEGTERIIAESAGKPMPAFMVGIGISEEIPANAPARNF